MKESILGGVAALSSALAWAYGAILFRKLVEKVLPVGLTLIKSLIGIFYIGILLIFLRRETILWPDMLNLALSGLVGIAIGDALFFKSLLYLGPRLYYSFSGFNPKRVGFRDYGDRYRDGYCRGDLGFVGTRKQHIRASRQSQRDFLCPLIKYLYVRRNYPCQRRSEFNFSLTSDFYPPSFGYFRIIVLGYNNPPDGAMVAAVKRPQAPTLHLLFNICRYFRRVLAFSGCA